MVDGEMVVPTTRPERESLLRPALRKPLLTAPLRLALLGFLPDARLLVVPTAFQFPEEPFSREFLLCNFERFFNVVIEDFDFHPVRFRTFPGDACANFVDAPL
jgi:hypothetical protein